MKQRNNREMRQLISEISTKLKEMDDYSLRRVSAFVEEIELPPFAEKEEEE